MQQNPLKVLPMADRLTSYLFALLTTDHCLNCLGPFRQTRAATYAKLRLILTCRDVAAGHFIAAALASIATNLQIELT